MSLSLWFGSIFICLLLCSADDQQTNASYNVNITASLQNSTFDPEYGTAISPTDTNGRRFVLFRLFQRSSKSREPRVRGRRRKEVKERTAALALKMNEKLEEARQVLLDRMAAVSFNLINYEHDAAMNHNSTFLLTGGEDSDIMPQSDLTLPNRSIYVVTTAALPWRTGTAVNPLLRAAYLSRRMKLINSANSENGTYFGPDGTNLNETTCAASRQHASPAKQYVTLVIPWLELKEDRLELYGPNHTFTTPQEQEKYIRDWLKNDANMPCEADPSSGLRILFYPARYHSGLKSIFAMGDICGVLRNQTIDGDLSSAVCILEEPEHRENYVDVFAQHTYVYSFCYISHLITVNWYRAPGEGWTKVFSYVVGIIHTNYIEYASTQFHGLWTAPAIQIMSSAMIRAYCHKVIKLSGVLQTYAPEKEVVENVHGVREDFIREGRRRSATLESANRLPLNEESGGQVYYIGNQKELR